MARDFRIIAAEKQANALSKIPKEWRLPEEVTTKTSETSSISVIDSPRAFGILSPVEISITENYTAVALAKELAAARLTAVQVTEAFCKRAAIAQQLTNCLTETLFTEANERAKFLDEYLAHHGKPMGPLHGLPISVKDCFNIKGVPSTLGYIKFYSNPLPQENSPLIDILLSLGAVIHVKTNIPQTMMAADSHNNLFGRTLNPRRLNHTAGGSSGGEGACIAMRGSILGVGTDIAGSIRIPSLCCGTYGFKPSTNRIPYSGQTSSGRKGSPGVKASAGPLANSAEDLQLLFNSVLCANPWNIDAAALAMPLKDIRPKSRLRLGFIPQDPAHPVTPPIARALKIAVEKLKAAGHEFVTPELQPSPAEATDLCWKFFLTDPQNTSDKIIKEGGEPLVPVIKQTWQDPKLPLVEMDEYYDVNVKRKDLKTEWLKLFVEQEFDAMILPGYISTAPEHDKYGTVCYTAFAVLLDYPAVLLPFEVADKNKDLAVASIPDYNPDTSHGLPCAIQLIARTQHDEELLMVAQIVDSVLRRKD